jgi:hypothetical protein
LGSGAWRAPPASGALARLLLAVQHVGAGHLLLARAHQGQFHLVLDVLDVQGAAGRHAAPEGGVDLAVSFGTVS